jgi:5-methylcytosine-specific restriction endonuclease McrA
MTSKKSGTAVLRKYLEDNVGREIPLPELNDLCSKEGLHHWDRVIRNLIQQEGYDIENKRGQWYKLRSLKRKPVAGKRGSISKKIRYLVFERDNFTCQACGRTPTKDGVKLSPDHIVPVDWGGETALENLQALCRECNEGKQAWVKGEDSTIMKKVNKQTNAEDRLRVYFEAHPNKEI